MRHKNKNLASMFHANPVSTYVLVFIMVLAAILRLYNLPGRLYLGNETSREALIGLIGAREIQLPLTSQFSSAGQFTHGVWFWWHYILASLFIPSLYAPWLIQIALSIGFVYIVYRIGIRLHSRALGLLSAYSVAISPPQLIAATHLANPNLFIFYAGVSMFLFLTLISEKRSLSWYLLIGATVGIMASIHYSGGNYIPLLGLLLLMSSDRLRKGMALLGGFMLVNIPYIVFNLLNHWFIAKNFLYYVLHGRELLYVPNSWRIYLTDFWPVFWSDAIGVTIPVGIALAVVTAISIGYELWTGKKREFRVFVLYFLFLVVAIRYYWGERFLGYFNFFHPFVFIFVGLPLATLWRVPRIWTKWVSIILLVGYTTLVFPTSMKKLETQVFVADMQELSTQIITAYPREQIRLYTCRVGSASRDYSILFFLYGKKHEGEGRRIAFVDEACPTTFGTGLDAVTADRVPEEVTWNMIDITKIPDELVQAAGYEPLTPKSFYDAHVKWWYREQP